MYSFNKPFVAILMPKLNFWLAMGAIALFFLTSGITLRDRIMVHSLHLIHQNALVKPPKKLLFENAVGGMIDALHPLHDDYSVYIPHIEQGHFENHLDNRYEGIGVIYSTLSKNELWPEIIYPMRNSPAFEAGLRSGDKILKVDGKSTKGLSQGKVAELFKLSPGKTVDMTVQPFGKDEPVEVIVGKAPLHRDSVEGDDIDEEGKRVFCLKTRPEIGYIRITSFSEQTAREVRSALESFSSDNYGLILDLRDNPGGYVYSSVEIANFFLKTDGKPKTIVSTRYPDGRIKSVHRTRNVDTHYDKPLVILIDGDSASASEILASCLQDYDRATIVGTRSFGKGTVQEIFNLPLNSGTVSLSDASYWRPSQKNINRSKDATEDDQWGVMPDPEGILPISKKQGYAQLMIRERRSNAISGKKEEFMNRFIERLTQRFNQQGDDQDVAAIVGQTIDEAVDVELDTEQFSDDSKTGLKDDQSMPFKLSGNAPYFDPQLDRAIELLGESSKMISAFVFEETGRKF